MGLPKNRTNNLKGRPPGIPNKTTQELRDALQLFIEANIEKLQADFNKLEPEKRLQFFDKICRQVLPPPINPEQLTESQMLQIIKYIQDNEKIS